MDAVCENMNFFHSSYGQGTLQKRPADDRAAYRTRFHEPAWGAVLSVVEDLFMKGWPCPWQDNFGETCTGTIEKGQTTKNAETHI